MSYVLHLGDALDVMRTLEAGSIDAVITDPPYCAGGISEAQRSRSDGQGLRSETIKRFGWFIGDNMGTAGLAWLLRSVAIEAKRIVKPSGSILMFCDWRMVSTLQPAIESTGLRFQNLVVWDKGHMGLGTGFRNRHELIMHFTLGAPEYHDMSIANVILAKRITAQEREHQTQKPVDLISQLVRVVSPVDGTVLDPFMGSGTTGVACVQTGRDFIGCDSDPTYHAIAQRRIEDAAAQPMLFEVMP